MSPLNEPTSPPLDFEQAIKRLEEIVHDLEEGQIGVNEALDRYEEGVKLLRQSFDLLERAQRRIELLSGIDAEGNPITRPVEDQSTLASEGQGSPRRRRRSDDTSGPAKKLGECPPPADETDMDVPGGLF